MGRLSRPVRSRLRPRPRHRATRPHPSTTFNIPAHARTQPQGPSAGTAYRGRVSAPSGTGPRCGGAGKAARWPPFQSPSRGRRRRTLSQQPLHGSRPHKTPGPHANPRRHGRRHAQRVNPDPTDRHLSRSFEIAMARRRSQPPNQPREIALRPVEVDCPVKPDSRRCRRHPILVHMVVPRIERDHRHGPVRAVLGSTRLGGGPQGRDDRVGGHGPPSSADSGNGWLQTPRNPGAGTRNGRFHDRIHVRLGRRLEPETRTDWTLWRKPAERMYHDAPDTTCCLPHDTRRQVSTSGHLRTNPARNSWNSRPGSGPGYDLPAVLADHTCRAGHNQL